MNRRSSTRQAVRLALVAVLFVLMGVAVQYRSSAGLVSFAQADGRVSQTLTLLGETWRIDEPNVKQFVTPYPQIRFQPGDHVTIEAGGCVQTGGWGPTWKRYVNPSGPNADHLYHGLIWIPGVIGGPAATGVPPNPKRIIAYLGANQAFTIPSGVDTRQLYLRLGYEDDHYDDNGYSEHDDGTQNQCKGIGNAYVLIRIAHLQDGTTTTPPAPFDLVWESEDDNGIPLNAKWGWQVTHPGAFPDPNQCTDGPHKSPCTNWADIINLDTAYVCNYEQFEPGKDNSPPLYGVAGHGNWAAGTYVGRITWEEKSLAGLDDDYNFKFYPAGGAGLTDVRDNLGTEFDSDETIDHFNTPWWNQFHGAVDHGSDDEVNQNFFKEPDGTLGRYAIVTGLVGLEFCHGGVTELHPVWAIAIRVKDDDPMDEVWAMFIRRWGNEGFCSGDQHYLIDLPNDTYTFRLPWRPGAVSLAVSPSTVFKSRLGQATGPGVSWAVNQGVLVSFGLPAVPPGLIGPPIWGQGELEYGELHLQWTDGQGPAAIPRSATVRRLRGQLPVESVEPEKRVASLVAKMTPVQRSRFIALSPRPQVSYYAQAIRQGAVSRIRSLPTTPARARRVQYRSAPDPKKRARDQRTWDGLQKILGRRILR